MTISSAIAVDVYLEAEDLALSVHGKLENWEDNLKLWSQNWLGALVAYLPLAPSYEYTVRLTSDRAIAQFNAQYRQQDRPTDVLSFPTLDVEVLLPGQDLNEPFYLGDIIISTETAQRQADDRGYSLEQELTWLLTHGLLHLLGWDHPDDDSLEKMLAQQETLLGLVGLQAQSLSYYP